jgi:hypothetical protein
VAALYFSRAITMPIAMAIGHFAGVDDKAITVFGGLWSADVLIPSLIALIMLVTLCWRVPTAPKPVRWIWAHGRLVLGAAAVLDIALSLIGLVRRSEIDAHWMGSVCAVAADLYFLAYILANRRVRHAFAEFPAPVDPPAPANPAA